MSEDKVRPMLRAFVNALADALGIPMSFRQATNHPYTCTCIQCLDWWATVGPEDDPDAPGSFGPFSRDIVEIYCGIRGKEVWW